MRNTKLQWKWFRRGNKFNQGKYNVKMTRLPCNPTLGFKWIQIFLWFDTRSRCMYQITIWLGEGFFQRKSQNSPAQITFSSSHTPLMYPPEIFNSSWGKNNWKHILFDHLVGVLTKLFPIARNARHLLCFLDFCGEFP